MNHGLKRRRGFDSLVEGAFFGDIFDDDIGKLVFGNVWVRSQDFVALGCRAHCSHNIVLMGEQNLMRGSVKGGNFGPNDTHIDAMCGNEARAT